MKKTIKVADILSNVNSHLQHSTCSADVRRGSIFTLETILQATGNYRGFRYLDETEVPEGALPGINSGVDDYVAKFKDTDPTRVQYY